MYLKRLGNSIAYFPNISELKDNTNRLYSIGGSLYFNGQEVGSGSGDASNTWTNANDHTTYSTLSNAINTVNDNVVSLPDSAANDYSTYTTLSGLINTVNSNVDALPDSAANDYSTYTTLSGLINTVNSNVDALPDSAANDYSTYTTLSGLIDTVNSNVDSLPDSAANDYSTYTTLSSLIDTVNANVVLLPDSAANDYTTYTSLSSLINTVNSNVDALPDSAANDYSTYTTVTANLYSTWNSLDTRISALDAGSNTSVSDLIAGIEGANTNIDTIQSNIDTSISTGSVIPASDNSGYVGNALFTWSSGRFTSFNIEEELEVGGSVTIEGNLTVSGNVVTVNASELSLEDNMIYLNANNTVTNPDLGFAGNYNDGTYQHAGFFRDASDGRWKVYEGYTPEPDESPYINTSHGSFALATFEADEIIATKATINSVDVLSNDYSTYTTLSSLINTVNSNVVSLPDSAANDYSTYTTLSSLIDTVNANVVSLPDSAANDYSTYTTLSGLIDTVNANVDALPDSAANDYSTYTTLSGLINTVNANVDALPDSAANDYSTYTTLLGLINTVSANTSAAPDSAANDYTTYTTVTANLYNTYTTLNTAIDTVNGNVTPVSLDLVTPSSNLTGVVGNALSTYSSGYFNNLNVVSTIYSDKILYSNMYSNEVDLPNATTYHGMFAHVHATGAGYFSHNGSWNKLIDNTTPTIAATTALVAGGATNPSTSNLHVTGNAYISSDTLIGGTLTESSSIRLKENIIPLSNQLDKLMLLRPVEYDKIGSRSHEYGLIAEEVANVIPQAVSLGNSAIQYTRLVPALISAIQELKLEIEELKRGSIIS